MQRDAHSLHGPLKHWLVCHAGARKGPSVHPSFSKWNGVSHGFSQSPKFTSWVQTSPVSRMISALNSRAGVFQYTAPGVLMLPGRAHAKHCGNPGGLIFRRAAPGTVHQPSNSVAAELSMGGLPSQNPVSAAVEAVVTASRVCPTSVGPSVLTLPQRQRAAR